VTSDYSIDSVPEIKEILAMSTKRKNRKKKKKGGEGDGTGNVEATKEGADDEGGDEE